MPLKNSKVFECKHCDFVCSKQSNYDKHISTDKHKRLTNIENDNKNAKIFTCDLCSKHYFSRVGLWKHEKVCIKNNNIILSDIDIAANVSNIDKEINQVITKDMFMELINDNKEMIKIIKDQHEQIKSMIPKMGNTINNTTNNNNFNLNVFLNEQCKDAININEFIKSLKITLEDLYFTRKNGIAQGISNLMINGLKELDVYKRPIHCTDLKRDIVYIKEHDKWEKDDNNKIMKKTIEIVANKQRNKISDWVDLHPYWIEDEKLQYEYLTILNKITEPIDCDDKIEKKIIRNIAREVQITDIKKY
uniref:C2H2-type domain-containing protein n=1 Tax=viral metagenome TaxID=1070528 RepID=A0A6C0EZM7_9ZZZZ